MRQQARDCVSRARRLLKSGDEASLRYACLELRFAIEYITYANLLPRLPEVSDEALKKWTPKEVLLELLDIDPAADRSVTIAVGSEHEYGVPPPPQEMRVLGQDRRFSMRWANKHHNALGNVLHAPTIHQIETGAVSTASKIAGIAVAVADECERVLESPVYGVTFGPVIEFRCAECKAPVRRRSPSPNRVETVVCRSCGAIYDVAPGNTGDEVHLTLRQMKYRCFHCNGEGWLASHRAAVGAVIRCDKCGKELKIARKLYLTSPDDPDPEPRA